MFAAFLKHLRHICRCICICQCCTNIHEFDPEFHSIHNNNSDSNMTPAPQQNSDLIDSYFSFKPPSSTQPSTKTKGTSESSDVSYKSSKSTSSLISKKIDELENLISK